MSRVMGLNIKENEAFTIFLGLKAWTISLHGVTWKHTFLPSLHVKMGFFPHASPQPATRDHSLEDTVNTTSRMWGIAGEM